MTQNPPPAHPADAGPPLFRHLFSSAPAREHQTSARGFGGSMLLHGLLIALIIWAGRSRSLLPTVDAGAGTGTSAGAAGGGGGSGEDIAYIQLSSPAPAPAPAPEEPVPVPVPIPPIPVPVPEPAVTVAAAEVPDTAGTGVTAGTGTGTGTQTGSGSGAGPGTGGGTGGGEGTGVGSGTGPGTGKGRILAPYPEFLLIPPTAPGNVRGKTVVVRLAIDESGTVRDVELKPETGNRGYDRELRRVAMGWKFKPARDPANNPIAVQFDVTFNF